MRNTLPQLYFICVHVWSITDVILSQVRNDYLTTVGDKIDQDLAVQLCCLEIRFFFKDMPQIALDKKSNLEYLEKEVRAESYTVFSTLCDDDLVRTNVCFAYWLQIGLHKFLPRSILDSIKTKTLRKLIQQQFKKVAQLSERECMFRFLELLKSVQRFDHETFKCSLGVSTDAVEFELRRALVRVSITLRTYRWGRESETLNFPSIRLVGHNLIM